MVKKRIKAAFKILISCLLISYLTFKVNWAILIESIKDVNPYLYILSTIIGFVSSFFLAAKYYILIKNTAISQSVFTLLKINLISRFYSIFLPSAAGKEAVRWFKVTQNKRGRGLFFISTFFERLTFLLVLCIFGLIPLYFPTQNNSLIALRNQIAPLLFCGMALILIALGYFFIPPFRNFALFIIGKLMVLFLKNQDSDKILSNFTLNKPKFSLYVSIVGLSVVWHFFYLIRLFLLFQSASLSLSIVDIAWMGSLVLLLQILPISFAGLGVREGAYAYLFTIFNLPPEKGVMIGILFFSQMLILAGTGALLEIFE